MGCWENQASAGASGKGSTKWSRAARDENPKVAKGRTFWGAKVRARIAKQLEAIKDWTIVEGDGPAQTIYGEATWFVDPPYAGRPGSHYRHGSKGIDYEQLGAWCRYLPGQVMVCEQLGADWLPFERLGRVHGQRGASTEVVWYSEQQDSMTWRQPSLFAGAQA